MAGDIILQWNCVSLNTHREELEVLITNYSPSVICLQETRLKPNTDLTFKNYKSFYKSNASGQGGVGILVKNSILKSSVNLKTHLQAVAANVTIRGKAYTICSIYIPPSSNPSSSDIDNVISQFELPFLLCGDFNAHNTLWGVSE